MSFSSLKTACFNVKALPPFDKLVISSFAKASLYSMPFMTQSCLFFSAQIHDYQKAFPLFFLRRSTPAANNSSSLIAACLHNARTVYPSLFFEWLDLFVYSEGLHTGFY